MTVQIIARHDPGYTGTSRYIDNLAQSLRAQGENIQITFPDQFPPWQGIHSSFRRIGIDLQTFFSVYPVRVRNVRAEIDHIATQTMATLLLFNRFNRPVIVTVLDILPYLLKGNKQLNTFRHVFDYAFYRLALSGLKRAEMLIAISEYTKKTLVETLGIPPERIQVVYPAIDHTLFRILEIPDAFFIKYGLQRGNKYLLYVGSDDPRKNLRTLILSFCQSAPQHLDARLLVVGASYFPHQHKQLLEIVAQMGMEHQIRFIGPVPDTDLPYFYNLANFLVMPSLYEGFGLPVAEAMACGTRVLAVDRTSLPELTGVDSVLCPPTVEAITQSIHMCLETEALPESQVLRRQWTERFSWSNIAAQTRRVYDLVRS